MRKILTIIISAILICLIGLGIIGYYVEKDKLSEAEKDKIEEQVKQEEKEEEKLTIDVNKLDINQIEGYTPGQNLLNENDLQDNIEGVTVGGISLPYSIPYKNMEIVSIGEYNGKFIEDGSDDNKDNVLAMVIKNTSDEVIDYGEIKIRIRGTNKTIKFIVTKLKPGASAVVMESTGEVEFNIQDKYIYINSKVNTVENMPLMEDKVDITTNNKKITVKNLSDENLSEVYVYYKTVADGNCYLGGITYRAKFENIKKNKSVTSNTVHFSNTNCEIVKIECVLE